MKNKIGRNVLCPCGSGEKYKKCCKDKQASSLPTYSWMEEDGIHYLAPGVSPSTEQLEKMTKKYQKQIKNSPLWDEMVRKFGKEKAEELLLQCRAKLE